MGQDEEDIENPEGRRGDGEEIDGDKVFGVVMQEDCPSLVGVLAQWAILADGGICDTDAEFGQFGLDALAAPSGIAGPHPADEGNEFAIPRRSAASSTRCPAPEQPEGRLVPTDDGPRLNDQ